MIHKVVFIVYVLYCVEVGLFLLFFPWMRIWEQNALLQYFPHLKLVFLNQFFRGAVSGLGAVNLILAVWEFVHFQRYFKKI